MDLLLYWIASAVVKFLQALPLMWVARIGRAGGQLACWLDARHRRVASRNLALCLGPEKTPAEIQAITRENFRRIGENFACLVKTASMSLDELKPHMHVVGLEKMEPTGGEKSVGGRVVAVGHFGNFELFARAIQLASYAQGVTTYRALRSPRLNRLLLSLRERNGCLCFERRSEGAALRAIMGTKYIVLGLFSDQHAGNRGLRLPFFGRDCSTTKAPAVFALRYHLPLHTAICFRTGLGQWRVVAGDPISTHENGEARSVEAIMLDVNRAFEAAVRQDPANWFWVHNRWKPAPQRAAITTHEPETANTPTDADGA